MATPADDPAPPLCMRVPTYLGRSAISARGYDLSLPGADTRVALGALLEALLIIANVGSAVVLFPVLKRQHEGLALGYVTARIVESTFIAIAIGSLLAIVTLRQDVGGAGGAGSLVPVGRSLVAIHDRTFLLGPGWVVGASPRRGQ